MFSQSFSLTRSKSDNQINRSKVLSPTPIKEQSVCFLNQISQLNSFQRKLDALEREEPETHFIIRKFQSLNTFNMEQRCLERFGAAELRNIGSSLFEEQFDTQALASSDYPMPEIPSRSSNPVIYDSRFRESDDEDATIEVCRADSNSEVPRSLAAPVIHYSELVQH